MPPPNHHQVAAAINDAWLVLLAVWVLGMFGNKRTRERQSWTSWIAYYLLFALSFWMIGDSRRFGDICVIPHDRVPSLIGAIIFLAGFILALWSRFALGANWSGRVTLKEGHELIERGPYRLLRHPMYTGLILAVAGSAVVSGTAAALAAVVIFAAIHIWKLRKEERLLMGHFPKTYPAYRDRTKALVPFVY